MKSKTLKLCSYACRIMIALGAIFLVVLYSGVSIESEEGSGNTFYNVVEVVDGDTVKVQIDEDVETLRLIGIDTPETVDPRKPVQCFGIEASNKAKEILEDQTVRIEFDQTQGLRDKYNRLLAYVFLEDGTSYNKYMIEEGYAYEYTYQSVYKYQKEFQAAELMAMEDEKGLWSIDTCNGDTTQSADLEMEEALNKPKIKKSNSGICHEIGKSPYYENTKNYMPYDTIQDCLDSGGRLPKIT